jgi:hypothetical protein
MVHDACCSEDAVDAWFLFPLDAAGVGEGEVEEEVDVVASSSSSSSFWRRRRLHFSRKLVSASSATTARVAA